MEPYPCPYTIGSELSVVIHPLPDQPQPPANVRLKVLQTYTFTKSQAMKVAVISDSSNFDLPGVALLKLYDRRYLEERMDGNNEMSWDYDKELLAMHVGREVGKHRNEPPKPVIHAFTLEDVTEIDEAEAIFVDDDDLDDVEREAIKNLDETEVEQYQMEKSYRDRTMSWFKSESRAYFQLRKLQGRCVPEFYGTTTFDVDSISNISPGILLEVPGILIQFIDGITLDQLDADSPMVVNFPHIGQAAFNCIRRLALHGVLHGDIRLPNFIVREDGRVFVLDFAFSMFRKKALSDEEWKEEVDSEQEGFILKMFLDERRLRDKTPREPHSNRTNGYETFNRLIQKSRKSWINKYYEHINEPHDFEYKTDDKGNEFMFHLPNWTLKQDAATKRERYLESLDRWGLTIDSEE